MNCELRNSPYVTDTVHEGDEQYEIPAIGEDVEQTDRLQRALDQLMFDLLRTSSL